MQRFVYGYVNATWDPLCEHKAPTASLQFLSLTINRLLLYRIIAFYRAHRDRVRAHVATLHALPVDRYTGGHHPVTVPRGPTPPRRAPLLSFPASATTPKGLIVLADRSGPAVQEQKVPDCKDLGRVLPQQVWVSQKGLGKHSKKTQIANNQRNAKKHTPRTKKRTGPQ